MYTSLLAVVGAAVVAAAPTLEKRSLSSNDTAVLQLAHYLENLEYALYKGGYDKFSDAQFTAAGFPTGFREEIGTIASNEATHRDALAAVLTSNGEKPLPACTYKFPYTDPKSFVALGNTVSSVGVGAYLGGASLLADNKPLLTTAASILTNEARHVSFLRQGYEAPPAPNAYDTYLTALWAYNLAHALIVSCPQEPSGVVLLPTLTLVGPQPPANLRPTIAAGTTFSFSWDPSKYFVPVDPNADLFIAWVNQNSAPVFVKVNKTGYGKGSVALPKGLAGVAFAVLTTFSQGLGPQQLSQFGTLAGPAEVFLS